jgi:hypothetical protein
LEKQKAPLCCEKSGNGNNDGLGGVATLKHLTLVFVKNIFKIIIIFPSLYVASLNHM